MAITTLRPPGPTGTSFVQSARELAARPLEYITWLSTFGDVSMQRIGLLRIYVIKQPEHIRHVLQDNQRNYGKQTVGYHRAVPLLGQGLVTSDGDFWLRQRRIAQPAFHRARIAAFAATMQRAAEDLSASWLEAARQDGVVDVAGSLIDATLRIVCETLLGGDLPAETQVVKDAFPVASHEIIARMHAPVPVPLWLPTAANRRFLRARRALDDIVYKLIARRRQATGPGDGLLDMLLRAQDEETGAQMSDRQLRDEVLTMLLAGHETTATALTFAFHLLGSHPEVAERLNAEVRGVLGERLSPSLADLERLPYTRMIIEETMRLYPPLWVVSRSVAQDDEIGGCRIERGGMVMVSPWVTHRLPSLWEEPERFLPERFSPERAAPPRFAYFPFLGGPRQCIGSHFALMEAQILLATVARRLRLTHLGPVDLKLDPSLTLRPRGGLRMRAHA